MADMWVNIMVADMMVVLMANMKVDMVANMVADMVADIEVDKVANMFKTKLKCAECRVYSFLWCSSVQKPL